MRIAVIGGGISGLAAAHFLGRAGHEVVCIDPEQRPGGLIRSQRVDGFLCESGPQALLDGPAETRALIAEAGLGARLRRASPAARRRFIHFGKRLHRLPGNPIALLRSRLLTLRGKLRLLREPFIRGALPASGAEPTDESVLDFGIRRFGEQAARRILAPAMLGIYAGDAARLSMRSALPRIAELERASGSVIRGAMAMRRAGGGIGHAVSFPEGLEELPRALAEGMAAQRIAARATGLSRSGNEWRISLEGAGAASNVAAQAVVLAVPAAVAAALLEPLAPAATNALRAVRHASVAVACLGFQPGGAPLGIDLRGYGFLVARGGAPGAPKRAAAAAARAGTGPASPDGAAGPALLGCQYESSIFAERAPPGGVLLRAILGGTFAPGLVELPDDEIAARAVADLRALAGLRRAPDLVRIWRHRGAIPQYELGHGALVAATDAELRRHPGLHVIGNALRGVGLNDCIAAAAALARALPTG